MKRRVDKKVAIQEKDEELSSEGEEEEEEEETVQAPVPSKENKSALQRKKDSKNKKREEGDEMESKRLKKEAQAVSRLSNASSMKRDQARNSEGKGTSMTMEDMIPAKNKLTFKEKMIKWFKSKWFSLFMIFVTGWTMISEDLRQIAFKAIDPLFYVIILLI